MEILYPVSRLLVVLAAALATAASPAAGPGERFEAFSWIHVPNADSRWRGPNVSTMVEIAPWTTIPDAARRLKALPPGDRWVMLFIVAGVPRMCISTTGQPRFATKGRECGSKVRPDTSLTIAAPASKAAAIVAALRVSMDTISPASAKARITGMTRACSSSGGTTGAPGRVLSPPTSMISAPSAAMANPAAIATPGSRWVPPSLKLSGVAFRRPMSRGRSRPLPAQTLPPPLWGRAGVGGNPAPVGAAKPLPPSTGGKGSEATP